MSISSKKVLFSLSSAFFIEKCVIFNTKKQRGLSLCFRFFLLLYVFFNSDLFVFSLGLFHRVPPLHLKGEGVRQKSFGLGLSRHLWE